MNQKKIRRRLTDYWAVSDVPGGLSSSSLLTCWEIFFSSLKKRTDQKLVTLDEAETQIRTFPTRRSLVVLFFWVYQFCLSQVRTKPEDWVCSSHDNQVNIIGDLVFNSWHTTTVLVRMGWALHAVILMIFRRGWWCFHLIEEISELLTFIIG